MDSSRDKALSDSATSITYDSASDCGYRSGEISSSTHSSIHISEDASSAMDLSSHSTKLDQLLTFDSGCVIESSSSISQSDCNFSEEVLEEQEPIGKGSLLWSDVFAQDKDGDTLLHLAILEARSDVVFPLIRLSPHPDYLDSTNNLHQTLLHIAALSGKSNIVRRLVVSGATLDVQDHAGNTPLHIACRSGDLDCVQAILMPITKPEIDDANCFYDVYLTEQKLSHIMNLKNYDGQSCIHLVAARGFLKIMECLYNHHADMNEKDGTTGRTALHYAIENDNLQLIEILLKKCCADPLVENYAGMNAFDTAIDVCRRAPVASSRDVLRIFNIPFSYLESSDESSDSCDEIETSMSYRNCLNSSPKVYT